MTDNSNQSPIECDTFCRVVKSSKHTFVWTIERGSLNIRETGKYMESGPFEVPLTDEIKTKWAVRFYPKGIRSQFSNNISVSLVQLSNVSVEASFNISLLDTKKSRQRQNYTYRFAFDPHLEVKSCSLNAYIGRQQVNPYIFPDGTLTLVCDIEEILAQETLPYGKKSPDVSAHHRQLVKDLNFVFLDKTNKYDVTLTCGDKVFYCHKYMLSARSTVFQAMFQSNMLEDESGNVDIVDIHSYVLLEMLQYIYTGCSQNLEIHAKNLLATAEKYQLAHLKKSCEDELISKLGVENCIEMLLLGEMYQATNLKRATVNFFTRNQRKFDTINWKLMLKNHPNLVIELMDCLLKPKIEN